jgi:hypothetical protein
MDSLVRLSIIKVDWCLSTAFVLVLVIRPDVLAHGDSAAERPTSLESEATSEIGARKSRLDASILKLVNIPPCTLLPMPMPTNEEDIEETAAQTISEVSVGLSPTQVERLLGAPAYKAGSPICPEKSLNEDNWLYLVGYKPKFVRLFFRDGKCDLSSNLDYDGDPIYANWYNHRGAKNLASFALGKTVQEIIAAKGPPNHRISQKDRKTRSEIKGLAAEDAAILRAADEVLVYFFKEAGATPFPVTIDLTIKNGVCQRSVVGSGVFGGRGNRMRHTPGLPFILP